MVILLWLLFSVALANFARTRGRSFFKWLLVAVFLSPLVGLIILLCLPRRVATEAAPIAPPVPRRSSFEQWGDSYRTGREHGEKIKAWLGSSSAPESSSRVAPFNERLARILDPKN